jgi:two-component system chemotaxis response regulator CheB
VEVAPTRTDDSRPPRRTLAVRGAPQAPPAPAAPGAPGFGIVGIVASTGGPKALESVLGGLPADFPLPVVLVQHIDRGFVDGFTSWLDRVCALHVTRAQDGQTPRPGAVYVAPGDRHLRVQRRVLRLDDAEPVALQRPSGTLLLRSMADSFGDAGIGVLLTGMGEDGAEGLLAVRRAGGHTIAEDESTAVVYGMPAAAVRLGGVCESLPLGAIANRLSRLAAAGNEAQQQTLLSSSEPLRRQGDRQEVA